MSHKGQMNGFGGVKNILLVDANYICARAWYATGGLSFNGKGTGMALGAIQAVDACRELFGSDVVALAFDHGRGKRRLLYPQYKANRRENMTEVERASKIEYLRQIRRIPKMFRRMGYRNILFKRGYEADDVIASVCKTMGKKDRIVIVSADQDLWQLIRENVICYDPRAKKKTDRKTFMDAWGVVPEMWPHVKAMAGDASDNIPGITGVGLKTAAKYYCGKLKEGTKARDAIEAGLTVHNRNLKLIRLPLDDVGSFDLVEDDATAERRAYVLGKLGASDRRWKR